MEEVLPTLPDNFYDSCVTDPPYGIRFMGKAWDKFDIEKMHSQGKRKAGTNYLSMAAGKYSRSLTANHQFQLWSQMWAIEMYRVLKPGAFLIVFASPRTYHRMVCGIEDAGFQIRDQIFWTFSSGFPKSHNLDGEFEGYGTALKPAHEPILVAQKKIDRTVLNTMKKWGTGAINIKDSLIPGEPWFYGNQPKLSGARYNAGELTPKERHAHNITGGLDGRWPANLIHDGSEEVVALFPESSGQQGSVSGKEESRTGEANCYGEYNRVPFPKRTDKSGSAARFFYMAKTSGTDRNEGCSESLPNNHPTVKPTNLMRYLIKLFTPKGGHTIDPFNGSGSSGKAAMLEHFSYTGIDEDEHSIAISEARIAWALRNRSEQIPLIF